MDSEELLAQLADIHLPEPVSYWPPAIGWWILAAIALVLLVILFRKYASRARQQKICQYAVAELQRCYDSYSQADPANSDQSKLDYVNQFNTVVRRVALVHYPQANAASLDGASWVDFIRQKGESSLMTDEIAPCRASVNSGSRAYIKVTRSLTMTPVTKLPPLLKD